mgnify:FL=1
MPEQIKDYSKIWSELSSETREICQLIGTAPIGLNNFELIVEEEKSKAVLTELKERGLIIERTYREELEEKAKKISEDRKKEMTSPSGPIPSLTKTEKDALNAIGSLKEQSEQSLNSMRLQLDPDFGQFVEGVDIVEVNENETAVIQPGETKVSVTRLDGEPEEIEKALSMIEQGKKLQLEYEPMDQVDLEKEYQRIYSDFDLAMRHDDKLRAIMCVLVEKYHIDEKDIARLRK